MPVHVAAACHVPVASEKIVSPSPCVCDGLDRARVAVVGHLRHARGLRPWSASRWWRRGRWSVFSPARGGRAAPPRAQHLARVREALPSGLRTPATTWPVAGSMMSPTALTATIAATTSPFGIVIAARADARLSSTRAGRRRTCRPSRRRRRRRCLRPPARSSRPRRPRSRSRRSGGSSGCRRRRDRTGSPPARSARAAAPRGLADVVLVEPAHHAGRRVEAERAAAGEDDGVDLLDHVERIEQVRLARARARRRARRRRRPRPVLTRITVQPVGRSVSVKWPTLMPSTAVSVMLSAAGLTDAATEIGSSASDELRRSHAGRDRVSPSDGLACSSDEPAERVRNRNFTPSWMIRPSCALRIVPKSRRPDRRRRVVRSAPG